MPTQSLKPASSEIRGWVPSTLPAANTKVKQLNYVADLRNTMLNDVILALAIISVPLALLSISRASVIGWRATFGLQVFAVAFIWLFWALRANIRYGWRVGILLVLLAAIGLSGYADLGPAAIAGQFLLLFLVVAALFMRAMPAFYSGVAIATLLAFVAVGAVNGKLIVSLDYASYVKDPATWIALIMSVAGFGGAIAMMTARLINEVESYSDLLGTANEELLASRDRAEAANRQKSEILANLSHEFRTPMNGIIGMADLLDLTDEDPERKAYIHELQTSAHSLRSMLDRMLDYVCLGDGKVNLEESSFDLCELAEHAVKRVKEAAEAKGVAVSFDCEQVRSTLATGDGRRMQQVLSELLKNAVHFTHGGMITLRICRIQTPVGDDRLWIAFEVTDTGVGIRPELCKAVFEPFVQADGSITRKVGGNGLGLAICDRIVRLMGGNISMSSILGVGSTFAVNVPFRQ